jgi:Zn-dependent peptidase ImmA (M78 family)
MENISLKSLRDKYDCSALKELISIYPVPIGKICSSLGIEAAYLPMSEDISGRIYCANDKYFIEANCRHVITRRRFTVAHELGHYCLHKDFLDSSGMILERSTRSFVIRDKEIEADNFAAELLMPQVHFLKKHDELKSIVSLSRYFLVSTLAIDMRIKTLLGKQ